MVLGKLGENTEIDEDSNGNTVLRNTKTGVAITLAQAVELANGGLGSDSQPVPNTSHFEAVSTEQADITNETLLDVTLNSSLALSANTFSRIPFDQVAKDERNEFDTSNNVFVPDETGWYLVSYNVRFSSPSDGDKIQAQFNDFTAGVAEINQLVSAGAASVHVIGQSRVVELTAGNTYEAKARNINSSDTVKTGSSDTYLTIRRLFR